MRFIPIAIVLLGCVLTMAAVRLVAQRANQPLPQNDDDLGLIGDFALTERSGSAVKRDDLLGKVWVASFVFTCCTQACPQVTGTMAQLHTELADAADFRLVTFTVDPERDRPAVLKEYARRYGAEDDRWLFLTGEQAPLYDLITSSFKLAVQQNEGAARTPGNEVTHSSRLVLVDRRGHIRGYFEGRRTNDKGEPVDELPALKRKIAALLAEPAGTP